MPVSANNLITKFKGKLQFWDDCFTFSFIMHINSFSTASTLEYSPKSTLGTIKTNDYECDANVTLKCCDTCHQITWRGSTVHPGLIATLRFSVHHDRSCCSSSLNGAFSQQSWLLNSCSLWEGSEKKHTPKRKWMLYWQMFLQQKTCACWN